MSDSGEAEANHWPSFVDVLSTVVMVVAFLLVIMSAAVMILSQRIIAEVRNEAEKRTTAVDSSSSPTPPVDIVESLKAQLAEAQAALREVQTTPIKSPKDAADGQSIAELGTILRQERTVDGDIRLTIRTRETEDTEKVKVKAMEQPKDQTGAEVVTADLLLRVDFEPSAVRYDQESEDQVIDFLNTRAKVGDAKIEVWSFVPQVGSITEANRIAYYRAILTRNILVKSGIEPARISTQVRVVDPGQDNSHNVQVVLKP